MIYPKEPATAHDIAGHYDELDAFYREVWGEHIHHGLWLTRSDTPEQAVVQLMTRVVQLAAIPRGAQVCDVGCGYGATARYIAEKWDASVMALTLSGVQVAYAEGLPGWQGNPTYLQGDWMDNQLPDQAFDTVVSIESLEHMPDKQRFFDEAYRVLRPGGRLAVTAWLANETPRPWEVRWLLEPICRESHLPALGSATDYRRCLEKAGFMLETFEDLSTNVRRTWPICLGRILKGLFTQPKYVRYLFDRTQNNRIFALTMLRIWLAYHTGAFRYGLYLAHR